MFLFNRLQQAAEAATQPYRKILRCYSFAFNMESHIKTREVNSGGKIFLPQSALEYLLQQHISYPMHFMVRSPKTGLFTHCGVLEFTAPEGRCYMPLWMMKRIGAEDEDAIEVAYTVLPLGTGVTLQACSKKFLDISDHRAVLEVMMTKYAALTIGDTIVFNYNDRDYELEVRDVLPHNRQNAINIVETNLAIEFERPKDMLPEDDLPKPTAAPADGAKKKKKKKSHKRKREEEDDDGGNLILEEDESLLADHPASNPILSKSDGYTAFSGEGHSLSSDLSSSSSIYRPSLTSSTSTHHHADSGTQFVSFSGEAHTLSGRLNPQYSYSSSSSQSSLTSSTKTPSRNTSNNTFGRSSLTSSTPPSSSSHFVAFQGEGHRLG